MLKNDVRRADAMSRSLPARSAPALIARAMAEVEANVELEAMALSVIRKCRRLSAIMELTFTGTGQDIEVARKDAVAAIDALQARIGRPPASLD